MQLTDKNHSYYSLCQIILSNTDSTVTFCHTQSAISGLLKMLYKKSCWLFNADSPAIKMVSFILSLRWLSTEQFCSPLPPWLSIFNDVEWLENVMGQSSPRNKLELVWSVEEKFNMGLSRGVEQPENYKILFGIM